MNVIDVNSGNRTKADDNQEEHVLEVNLAAAAEVARQLRLRDLGGIVIIDFIDMHKAQSRQLLYDEMQRLMATDKARHTILPLTKFGLMQITRQRIRPVAVKDIRELCPTCGGSGKVEPTVLLERTIENQLSLIADEHGERFVDLVVSPYVAAFLKKGIFSLRNRWVLRFGMYIRVTASQSAGIIEVKYLDRKGEDMLHPNYVGSRKPKNKVSIDVDKITPQSKDRKGSRGKRKGKKSTETKDKE
jgi:ribonuclease G